MHNKLSCKNNKVEFLCPELSKVYIFKFTGGYWVMGRAEWRRRGAFKISDVKTIQLREGKIIEKYCSDEKIFLAEIQ